MSHIKQEDLADAISIRTFYQPIVRFDGGALIGHEAYSRGPDDSNEDNPLTLLDGASEVDRRLSIDSLMRSTALKNCNWTCMECRLFLNVDAQALLDPRFEATLLESLETNEGYCVTDVVLEVNERAVLGNPDTFEKILKHYISIGFKVAIDDVGAGYQGLSLISSALPDYIKVDMSIIRDIDTDKVKQSLIRSIIQLGQDTNIKVIAKGIETYEELRTLFELGVYGGQGFYFQHPSMDILPLDERRLTDLKQLCAVNRNNAYSEAYHYIGMLADHVRTFSPVTKCHDVERFFQIEKTDSVCITTGNTVLGTITRHNLYRVLATRYGHALYLNRPIELLLEKNHLSVDYYMDINSVAELAMKRPSPATYDPIVVVKGSKYYGTVTVKTLLQHALRLEKDYARELNPLTNLPGNKIINRVLSDVLQYAENAAVIYFDLNHFKSYNDIYGFENGDRMIMLLARLLERTIKSHDAINSFLGHIGGDDFIVVMNRTDRQTVESLLQLTLERFDDERRELFNGEDLERGTLIAEDRFGIQRSLPLTALSAACFMGDFTTFKDSNHLTQEIAHLKKVAKAPGTSAFEIIEIIESGAFEDGPVPA